MTVASAISQLPFILAVCEGPELRVAAFSDVTRALLPGREVLGTPMRELISDLSGQQIVDAYYDVYRTQEPVTGREWRFHLDTPDGSVHEFWATFSIVPWRDPDGRLRGVIGSGFDVTESVRARQAAQSQAVELRERWEQSLDVVHALQRALLPAGLPVLPGAQVAASYRLADGDASAGGDWFDAVSRADGTVALVVGDVVGHGVTASGVMGQLRAVLHDRLDAGADIAEALAAADRYARRRPAAHATTVCVAVLDQADGALSYCTAGHPAPLVVADGRTRYLTGTGGTPLGTGGGSFPVRTDRLEPGDLLLLFTDGILERPGRTLPAGAAELAGVAADSAAGRAWRAPGTTPADRVCEQVVELLVRTTGHSDDITLLAAQRVVPAVPLDLRLPAEPESLRPARTALAEWLGRIGAAEKDTFLLQHALGELMTNAIEHAFDQGARPAAAVVGLHARLTVQGCLEATVTDQGRWREPARQSQRGRGLAMTSQLVESMHVQPTAAGTVAGVRHTLIRPARMLTGAQPGPRPAAPEVPFAVEDLPGDAGIRVRGPVDAATAGRLRQRMLGHSRGGALPLTVDLTEVTHLASAGVSVLHQVAEQHAAQGGELTLTAAPDSPARHVLDLIGLPDVTVAAA